MRFLVYAKTKNKKHPNAEFSKLHLSEKMIELLKTTNVSNQLCNY